MGRSTSNSNTSQDLILGKIPGEQQFDKFGSNPLINILSTHIIGI